MPNTERVPGLRGRLPAVIPDGLQTLGAYLIAPLPAAVLPIDASGGFAGWEMLGNGPDSTLTITTPTGKGGPVGDCGFCGMAHKRMADAAVESEPQHPFTANDVVTEYLAYDNGQDNGVQVSDMMHAWFTTGFFGGKIDGYAPVAPDQIDAAMAVFGAVIVGVDLTDDADQLFSEGKPWNVDNGQSPDSSAGHCIVKIRSTADLDTYVTWGAEQDATKGWSASCIREAWVPITAEMAQRWSVALAILAKDITALGGQSDVPPPPAPVPAPPVPGHGPPPSAPTPVPGVVADVERVVEEVVDEVEHLEQEVVQDLEG